MISHSKAHFLLGTKCASFLSHNFEYKIVCHCIEEHPSKIRKKIATTSMLSLSKRESNKIFCILKEQRKAEIKKQQNNNKNTTKSILQCLFSSITQHSVTIRQENKLGFNASTLRHSGMM